MYLSIGQSFNQCVRLVRFILFIHMHKIQIYTIYIYITMCHMYQCVKCHMFISVRLFLGPSVCPPLSWSVRLFFCLSCLSVHLSACLSCGPSAFTKQRLPYIPYPLEAQQPLRFITSPLEAQQPLPYIPSPLLTSQSTPHDDVSFN